MCVIAGVLAAGLRGDAWVPQRAPVPPGVAGALDRYARGEFDEALADLTAGRSLPASAEALRRHAGGWVDAAAPGARAGRQAVAAALAAEVVALAVEGTLADYAGAKALVEWACDALRRGPPTEFERVFHLATVALLQAAGDEELLVGHQALGTASARHVWHGASRFPDESRFRLAWITTRHEAHVIASRPVAPAHLRRDGHKVPDYPAARAELLETVTDLGRLVEDPAVGPEARLRRGVLQFLMEEPVAARADLERAAGAGADPFVGYLAHVMVGRIAERNGDLETAIARYSTAARIIPATAASLAQAAALVQSGRGNEAAAVVTAWSDAPRPDDPWRWYAMRDYRLWPAYRSRLRALAVS